MKKVNITLVGLAFGGSFLPIYLDHPLVESVSVFDTDKDLLATMKKNILPLLCIILLRIS